MYNACIRFLYLEMDILGSYSFYFNKFFDPVRFMDWSNFSFMGFLEKRNEEKVHDMVIYFIGDFFVFDFASFYSRHGRHPALRSAGATRPGDPAVRLCGRVTPLGNRQP